MQSPVNSMYTCSTPGQFIQGQPGHLLSPQNIPTSNVVTNAHNDIYRHTPSATPCSPTLMYFTPAPVQQFPSAPQSLSAPVGNSILPPVPPTTRPPQQPTSPSIDAVLHDIYQRLSKLDTLDHIVRRLDVIEGKFATIEASITEMRGELRNHSEQLEGVDFNYTILEDRISKVENQRDDSQLQCGELHERLLELQTRSMKSNLLFGGIPETNNPDEDSVQVIQNFIKNELDIQDEIEFQVAHRLRKRPDGKPRSIVAVFSKHKDRDTVLKAVPGKLAEKKEYSVYEQFPPEVTERRKILYPMYKDAKRRGQKATLKADKLYINGRHISPHPPAQPNGPDHRGNLQRGQPRGAHGDQRHDTTHNQMDEGHRGHHQGSHRGHPQGHHQPTPTASFQPFQPLQPRGYDVNDHHRP